MRPARTVTPLGTLLNDEGRRQSWLADRLSELLGRQVSRGEVNRWVHGLHIPEQGTREAIARVLERGVDELWPALAAEPEREAA